MIVLFTQVPRSDLHKISEPLEFIASSTIDLKRFGNFFFTFS
jgi:hypothetical protein